MKPKFNKPHKKTSKPQFSLKNTRLPNDTRQIKLPLIDNFALRLNKAVQFDNEGKPRFFHKTEYNILKEGNLIDRLKNTAQKYAHQYKEWIKKYAHLEISLTLSWRLVVGLGNPSVYETSMTLHHIYGIPYLPGSAIKGVTRSYAILSLAEGLQEPENYYDRVALLEKFLETFNLIDELDKDKFPQWEAVKKTIIPSVEDNKKISFSEQLYKILKGKQTQLQKFQLIFGTQDRQGCIIFFDAFPEDFDIEYDIMNPHYGPYYSDKQPPADYYNPTPIPFLVLKNAQFTFHLGVKNRLISSERKDNLLNTALNWLKEALTNYGLGAKTALGYGLFKI